MTDVIAGSNIMTSTTAIKPSAYCSVSSRPVCIFSPAPARQWRRVLLRQRLRPSTCGALPRLLMTSLVAAVVLGLLIASARGTTTAGTIVVERPRPRACALKSQGLLVRCHLSSTTMVELAIVCGPSAACAVRGGPARRPKVVGRCVVAVSWQGMSRKVVEREHTRRVTEG